MSERRVGREIWHVQRTLLFWVVGLLNTAFLKPDDVGTWKHWIGWLLIVLAVLDSVALVWRWRRRRSAVECGGC